MVTIALQGDGVSESQDFDISIAIEASIKVDAQTARKNVTGWLIDEVGNMLIGGKPQLVIGQQTVWRIPIILTSSVLGAIGKVGAVDVDVTTGKPQTNQKLRKQILKNVEQFVSSPS